jgi:hypothetical protein
MRGFRIGGTDAIRATLDRSAGRTDSSRKPIMYCRYQRSLCPPICAHEQWHIIVLVDHAHVLLNDRSRCKDVCADIEPDNVARISINATVCINAER